MSWNERTILLLGDQCALRLAQSHVLVVGLGGVGGIAAEMLCRAGVGEMTLVDGDSVDETNRNRQLHALLSTQGKPKTDVLAQRFHDINPEIRLHCIHEFLRDQKTEELLDSCSFDYVIDCIDTLSPKTFLIYHAVKRGLKVVTSMGSGGKTDPAKVMVADISETFECKLARAVRKRLHRLGIRKGVKAVFSSEEVPEHAVKPEAGTNKNSNVGTVSYMPAIFGCFIAGLVVRELTGLTDVGPDVRNPKDQPENRKVGSSEQITETD
jgi:tRNA A37 threonylcarbamoyladenosine dehydratase